MRRLLVVLIAFALAGTLVFPSGAVPLLGAADPVSEEVTLAPIDAPNGDYAYLEDGELVVDLTAANPNVSGEGINDDAITTVDDVFLIHYNGSQYADVWVTDGSEDVTFYARGHPIQSEANNVTLGPNRSVAVGFSVDTRGQTVDGLIDDLTVHAKVAEPPKNGSQTASVGALGGDTVSVQTSVPNATTRRFEISDADVGEEIVLDAESLVLDRDQADATLTLDELVVTAGSDDVDLEATVVERPSVGGAGSETLGALAINVERGNVESATLRFSVARSYLATRGLDADQLVVYHGGDGEGEGWMTLDATVTKSSGERVHFEAETPGFSQFVVAARVPSIGVTDAGLQSSTITANETATVTAQVKNDGATAGERNVTLALNGTVVETRTVALGPQSSTTIQFTVAPPTGEHTVRVGGVKAGTLTVESLPTINEGSGGAAARTETTTTLDATTTDAVQANNQLAAEPSGLGLGSLGGLVLRSPYSWPSLC
ncbi:PGF-pre-PGF domain-containing protein [Halospeciosus flavus]|uniref:PGF-pre-PGF domain-containing protein n=1 Tax=Halospeciosus flavus TaxID=3032283 RepID=UPI0036121EAD